MEGILPYLHLARRSGKLALGYKAVKKSLAQEHCQLLLLARDAGASLGRLEEGDVPAFRLSDRAALGAAFGREKLSVLALTEPNLAKAVIDRLESK